MYFGLGHTGEVKRSKGKVTAVNDPKTCVSTIFS